MALARVRVSGVAVAVEAVSATAARACADVHAAGAAIARIGWVRFTWVAVSVLAEPSGRRMEVGSRGFALHDLAALQA